ncbi:MAG: tetratricopeptide repeat protein [Pseudomonadota bacterium]
MSNDSFIREVDEELRSEKLKSAWDRYGPIIIGTAITIAVGTAAYTGWQSYTNGRANASGDRFLEALTLAQEGQSDAALTALGQLEQDGFGQYAVLARMRAAGERHNAGDTEQAIADFDTIAADNSVPVALRDVARVRAGYLLVDAGTYDDVAQRVEPLTSTENPFRHSAREALGMAAWKAERADDAKRLFDTMLEDPETPQAMRGRAGVMVDMIVASGKVSAG